MTFNITGWKIDSDQMLTKKVKPVFMNPIFFGFLLAIVICMIVVYVLKDDDIDEPGYKLLRLFVGISAVSAVFSFAHHSYLINKYEKILEDQSPVQMIQNNNNIPGINPSQIPSINDNNFGESPAPTYNGIDTLTANNLKVNDALQQYGSTPPPQAMYTSAQPGMQGMVANPTMTLGGNYSGAPPQQQYMGQQQYMSQQQPPRAPQLPMPQQQGVMGGDTGSGALVGGLNIGY